MKKFKWKFKSSFEGQVACLAAIGFILFLATLSPARADGPGDADDVTKIVNAQVQVTRDNLANLQAQLGALEGNPYEDASYKPLAEQFKRDIDLAFSKFDRAMSETVLPKAQYWLNRHMELAKTMGVTADLIGNTQTQMQMVSKDYQNAILDLYQEVLGDLPVSARIVPVSSAALAECSPLPETWQKIARKKKVQIYLTSFRMELPSWKGTERVTLPYCQIGAYGYSGGIVPTGGGNETVSDAISGILPVIERNGIFPRIFQVPYDPDYWTRNFDSLFGIYDLSYGSPVPIPDEISPAVFMRERISDQATRGCETLKCRQLRVNDFMQFVTLVQATINKDIVFTSISSDGRIKLDSLGLELGPLRGALRSLALMIQ